MKKFGVKVLAIAMSVLTVLSSVPSIDVSADSQRIITLGNDLSEEQKDTVLAFFGVSDEELSNIEVVTITNEDEHNLLGDIVPASVIGSRTFSCAYIEPTMSGGINIKTANLTYVTMNSLYNALQTAGIENCNLIVTAPFEVSGTGALTGVFKAFEASGNELDEDKQEVAAEELILDAELEENYGEDSSSMVSDVKSEIVSASSDLSSKEIETIITDKASNYNIELASEDMQNLVTLMDKLQKLEYDVDAFTAKLNDIQESVEAKAEETGGILDAIADFFKAIFNFFKDLFGFSSDSTAEPDTTSEPSIFDNVDTNVFQYDDEKDVTSSEPTADVSTTSGSSITSEKTVEDISNDTQSVAE